MTGYDDPLLMDPGDIPSGPPLPPEEMAARLAETYAAATDEEVAWLIARVLTDHGLECRPGWMADQMRMQAGFAVMHRNSGMPARWLYRTVMDLHGVEDDPRPEVAAIKRRVAERMMQMASVGFQP